jgi:hypothetical protein
MAMKIIGCPAEHGAVVHRGQDLRHKYSTVPSVSQTDIDAAPVCAKQCVVNHRDRAEATSMNNSGSDSMTGTRGGGDHWCWEQVP